ncbi:MAG: invasion associated locus B family protein [Alphaproteobacteria bacterium]|nr:invasion associated locus B family protein [Alphaproteobacteria bacterium]
MNFQHTRWIRPAALAAAVIVATASAVSAATLVKTYRDWSVFSHDKSNNKICFAATQPKDSTPAGSNRDGVFFYVSAWPNDGVKSEISVRLGYTIKQGSTVKVSVGSSGFDLFAKDDKAFVADPTQELKLIEAMKRGSTMKVEATSDQGSATSDTFSLLGVSAALKGLANTCK